jgi:conjugative transfer signal peptidase TraF
MAVAVQLFLANMSDSLNRLRSNPRDVLRRHRLALIALTLLALLILLSIPFARVIVVNPTDSLPRGLYIKTSAPRTTSSIVEFRTPASARAHLQGHYAYLLKPIAAGPGDHVDTTTGQVLINGHAIPNSRLLTTDSTGRAVTPWLASRTLGPDEYFVLSTRIPNSIDSRYFGPIHHSDITTTRRCLWAWE